MHFNKIHIGNGTGKLYSNYIILYHYYPTSLQTFDDKSKENLAKLKCETPVCAMPLPPLFPSPALQLQSLFYAVT